MAGLPVAQPVGDRAVMEREGLQRLLEILGARGYQIVGPTFRDGAILYDELTSIDDLPVGWTDDQEGGTYRLRRRTDQALFGYGVGPHSWKKFLHPAVLRLWRARRDGLGFQFIPEDESPPRYALVGARSCDLHAIAIQDRVFVAGPYVDPAYKVRRENALVVAVNCEHAGGTCFCVSMGTGPKATFGFDLALTEVLEAGRHYFVVEVGTERGAEIFRGVPHREARAEERDAAERIVARAAERMGRVMDTTDINHLLYRNPEHPRWDNVAGRCLTCGNCTMVCPTCFCFIVEDVNDLTGEVTERVRRWDVCFTTQFTYTAGKPLRLSARSRYRQWLTHKVGSWIDQFGTSGCVGCGRCITWCPVAIDITEEVRAIRETDGARVGAVERPG
ncbi:MAG: 4Fe-4S dicluster domain-containing protein [Chloroflexi bacterium]|nr:4Fe-4S dicluster domain-containing protein [Chloroflexota bacterium]